MEPHKDNLPPSLADLVPQWIDDPKAFLCPADAAPMKIRKDFLCSYRYIGNIPALDITADQFVVYDRTPHDEGRNVAHFDGHVRHYAEQEFKKKLAEQYEEFKPLMAKPGFPGDRERVKAFFEDKDFTEK